MMNEIMADKAGLQIRFGGCSACGPVRQQNEDSFLVMVRSKSVEEELQLPANCPFDALFAVTDGMGGVQNGQAASSAVVNGLRARMDSGYLHSLCKKYSVPFHDTAMLLRRLVEELKHDVDATGGAATLTLLVFRGNRWHLAYLGDSRAYLYTAGEARPQLISEDHKMGEKGALWNGLGAQFMGFKVCLREGELNADDMFFMHSDGVNRVPPQFFYRFVNDYDFQAASEECVARALEVDGRDNATVVMVRCCSPVEDSGNTIILPPMREEKQTSASLSPGQKWFLLSGILVFLLFMMMTAGVLLFIYWPREPETPRYLLDSVDSDVNRFCPVLYVNAPEGEFYSFEGAYRKRIGTNGRFKSEPLEWGETVKLTLYYSGDEIRTKSFVLPSKDKLMDIKKQGVVLGTNLIAFLEKQGAQEADEMARLAVKHPQEPGWPILTVEDPLSEDFFVGFEGERLTNNMVLYDVKWGSIYSYTVTNEVTGMSINRTLELQPKYLMDDMRRFLGKKDWAAWTDYLAPRQAEFVRMAIKPAPRAFVKTAQKGKRPEVGFEEYNDAVWTNKVPLGLKWGEAITVTMSNKLTAKQQQQQLELPLLDSKGWLPDGSWREVATAVYPLLAGKAKSDVEALLFVKRRQEEIAAYLKGSELNSEALYAIYQGLHQWAEVPDYIITAFTNCMNKCLIATTRPNDYQEVVQLSNLKVFQRVRNEYLNEMVAACSYIYPPFITNWQLGKGTHEPQWDHIELKKNANIYLIPKDTHKWVWQNEIERRNKSNTCVAVREYILKQDADFDVPCLDDGKKQSIMSALHNVHHYDCEQGGLTNLPLALSQAWALGGQEEYLTDTLTAALTVKSMRGLRGGKDYEPSKGDVKAFLNGFPDGLYDALAVEQKECISTQLSQWLETYSPGIWADWDKWPGSRPGIELAADALLLLAEEQVREFEQAVERSVKKEYKNAAEDYLEAVRHLIKKANENSTKIDGQINERYHDISRIKNSN